METTGIWAYRPDSGYQPGTDLAGFSVEAVDGRVGKVDQHGDEAGAGRIVVDTGGWVFGGKVLLPAGVISTVDAAGRVVSVGRTKDEIKNAPEFDPGRRRDDPDYHQQVGDYYARLTP
ncbi:hypothetical protein [Streptacidiphilus melanogenes]|uniref:hypothetical protein n=1 Tax=Streptacidiphilus melanogenes TaxID=411235 RepID=UPI0005AA7AF2|nr:hypothetical protein [Streptacidiphilus melanogenes]